MPKYSNCLLYKLPHFLFALIILIIKYMYLELWVDNVHKYI